MSVWVWEWVWECVGFFFRVFFFRVLEDVLWYTRRLFRAIDERIKQSSKADRCWNLFPAFVMQVLM